MSLFNIFIALLLLVLVVVFVVIIVRSVKSKKPVVAMVEYETMAEALAPSMSDMYNSGSMPQLSSVDSVDLSGSSMSGSSLTPEQEAAVNAYLSSSGLASS